jgi:hypothetical protein
MDFKTKIKKQIMKIVFYFELIIYFIVTDINFPKNQFVLQLQLIMFCQILVKLGRKVLIKPRTCW